MAENEIYESGMGVDGEADNVDYVAAIKELRENTVSKERHQKLQEENRKLIRALTNGETIDIEPKVKVDVDALRKELYGKDADLTNLDYVTKTLQLRDELIARGERDPFLPVGTKVSDTAEMYQKAQNVADVLRECVDFADGDSGIFTAELQRRTRDIMPMRRAR